MKPTHEIKFRAWSRRDKQMWEVLRIAFHEPESYNFVLVRAEKDGHFVFDQGYMQGYMGEVNTYILMQYIGAKDKNGIEIYEGDIIRSSDGKDYVIQWSDLTYRFIAQAIPANRENPQLDSQTIANYEIVGNIYENQEIIENETNP